MNDKLRLVRIKRIQPEPTDTNDGRSSIKIYNPSQYLFTETFSRMPYAKLKWFSVFSSVSYLYSCLSVLMSDCDQTERPDPSSLSIQSHHWSMWSLPAQCGGQSGHNNPNTNTKAQYINLLLTAKLFPRRNLSFVASSNVHNFIFWVSSSQWIIIVVHNGL